MIITGGGSLRRGRLGKNKVGVVYLKYSIFPVRKNQNAKCKRKATAVTDNTFYKFIL